MRPPTDVKTFKEHYVGGGLCTQHGCLSTPHTYHTSHCQAHPAYISDGSSSGDIDVVFYNQRPLMGGWWQVLIVCHAMAKERPPAVWAWWARLAVVKYCNLRHRVNAGVAASRMGLVLHVLRYDLGTVEVSE